MADTRAVPATEHARSATDSRARSILVLLGIFAILNFGDKAVLGLAGPDIREDLGLSHTQLGTIGSAFYLLFSVSCLLVGLLGGRWRPTTLLAGFAVVWAIAQLPILVPAAGFGALILTRVILGAGEGPALPMATHVIFTWYPAARRTWASGVLAVSGALGVILGGPFLAAVIMLFGWRAAFGVLGVAGLVWAAVWVTVGGHGPYHDDTVDGAELAAEPAARGALLRIFTTRTWLAAVACGFTVQYALGLAMSWLPTYLQDEAGYSETRAGMLVALPSLVALAAVPVAVLGTRRYLDPRRPAAGYAVLGVGLAGVPAAALLAMVAGARGPLLLLALAFAFGGSIGLVPVTAAAIGDLVPVHLRGAALSFGAAGSSLGAVASPWITGRLLDAMPTTAEGFRASFIVTAVLLAAGGAVLLLVDPRRDAARLGGPRLAPTGGSQ